VQQAPEFHLFCTALGRARNPPNPGTFPNAPLDWAAIAAGARRHRLAPLLLAGLKGWPEVPADLTVELRRQTQLAATRDLAQAAELARLVDAFAAAGIRVLALKGLALSIQLHQDAFPGGARDLDLLVDPLEFDRIDRVLADAGYRPAFALTPRQHASFRRWIKDMEYFHSASGAALEIHERLVDNPHLICFDFDTLWQQREEIRVGHVLVPTLSRRVLALYLCVHGAGHAWERLRWLADLAALLREPGSTDLALADAEAAGIGVAMLHAVMLAHDWLGLAVAPADRSRASTSKQVQRLDRILSRLYAGRAWCEMPARQSWHAIARYSLWQRLYRLMLKPDWRYGSSQIMREAFSPADFATLHIPDALFFVYPLLRPLGWMVRRWRQP